MRAKAPASGALVWDSFKENIQVCAGARPVSMFDSLVPSSSFEEERKQKIRELQQKVKETTSSNEKVEAWFNYLKYLQGTASLNDRKFAHDLERAVVSIAKTSPPPAPSRLLTSIFLKYASVHDDPADVFAYMWAHKIGCGEPRFYASWAAACEHNGRAREAREAIARGRRLGVPGLDKLLVDAEDFEEPEAHVEPIDELEPSALRAREEAPLPAQLVHTSENAPSAFAIYEGHTARSPVVGGAWSMPPRLKRLREENERHHNKSLVFAALPGCTCVDPFPKDDSAFEVFVDEPEDGPTVPPGAALGAPRAAKRKTKRKRRRGARDEQRRLARAMLNASEAEAP